MDGSILQTLGLGDDITVRADAYTGFGMFKWTESEIMRGASTSADPSRNLQLKQAVRRDLLSAAQCFVIGASLYACVKSSSARRAYWAASRCYELAGSLAAAALLPCALDLDRRIRLNETEPAALSADDVVALLIQDMWDHATGRQSRPELSYAAIEGNMGTRVGSAGIAFPVFESLRRAMSNFVPGSEPRPYILQPLGTLLGDYAQAVETAKADSYHWKRFQSVMLPVPPEVLAATVCVVMASASDIEPFIGDALHSDVGLIPVKIAKMIREPLDKPRTAIMKAISARQAELA